MSEIKDKKVDKETPLKYKIKIGRKYPIGKIEFVANCPGCDRGFELETYLPNYCHRCGQKIDWSDDYE